MPVKRLQDEVVCWIRSTYFPRFGEQAAEGCPDSEDLPATTFYYRAPVLPRSGFNEVGQIRMEVAWIVERIVKNLPSSCPPETIFDRIFASIEIEGRRYIDQHGDPGGTASRTFQEITAAINLKFRGRFQVEACSENGVRRIRPAIPR